MALKICTACGYEGQGKAAERGSGTGLKILGMLLMLPIYSIWRLFTGRSGNICPNCGLPAMVKLNSDAGWLAKRRLELKLGLAPAVEEKKPESFGRDAPSDSKERKPVDPEQW